jgi:hypothetical protein
VKPQLVAVLDLDGTVELTRRHICAVHLQRRVFKRLDIVGSYRSVHLQTVAQTGDDQVFVRRKIDARSGSHDFGDAELKLVSAKVWRRREGRR